MQPLRPSYSNVLCFCKPWLHVSDSIYSNLYIMFSFITALHTIGHTFYVLNVIPFFSVPVWEAGDIQEISGEMIQKRTLIASTSTEDYQCPYVQNVLGKTKTLLTLGTLRAGFFDKSTNLLDILIVV